MLKFPKISCDVKVFYQKSYGFSIKNRENVKGFCVKLNIIVFEENRLSFPKKIMQCLGYLLKIVRMLRFL